MKDMRDERRSKGLRMIPSLRDLHKKGRKRITIMLIPHTEKRILNIHTSIYTIFSVTLIISFIFLFSIVSLVDKSGDDIQFYDMSLGDKEFSQQAIYVAQEAIPVHRLLRHYLSIIYELYEKLGIAQINQAQGVHLDSLSPDAFSKMEQDLRLLELKLNACRENVKDCSETEIEAILKDILVFLYSDNKNLSKAILASELILKHLSSNESQELFSKTPSLLPTLGGFLLSPYGKQVDVLQGREYFHRGIRIINYSGAKVFATASGVVKQIDYDSDYGLQIVIDHLYGFSTFYAHLSHVRVGIGEEVEKGDSIAYVGQTGKASQPMLYYEVHIGTVTYNPYLFLNTLFNPWLIPPEI